MEWSERADTAIERYAAGETRGLDQRHDANMIGGPVAHGGRGHVRQHEIGLAAESLEDAVKRARFGHVEL